MLPLALLFLLPVPLPILGMLFLFRGKLYKKPQHLLIKCCIKYSCIYNENGITKAETLKL